MYKLTTDEPAGKAAEIIQSLDELAREGARRMILEALEVEVEEHVQALRQLRDEQGQAQVVRNTCAGAQCQCGKSHHERTVQMGAGSIQIRAPRVNDRRPDQRFSSHILPPYMRRSPRLEEALPVLRPKRTKSSIRQWEWCQRLKATVTNGAEPPDEQAIWNETNREKR